MHKPSKSAEKLHEAIKKAIEDGKLTSTEYDRIMMIADEDGVLDPQEKKLLAELHDLVADGTVKRVAG
jgi:tellurite resistance protein